ncbi:PAQR family membrane homeostasis protein TrhA [Paraglaciecola hydrolytica]|uniref:Hemolysin III family protein n=1 Tax=Paraglaciecola hydrolytica TaxID=1799789 RepID=A0A135ZZG6_9ALTE|nr:hemolysin III family protein [Paraglaciecola hydrolytica]KXI28375.1 hemolysin III family protein [Paraglaciecola hydrolytica]
MSQFNTLPIAYSAVEERFNALTHGLGFIAAVVGLVFLLIKAQGIYAQLVVSIYAVSMLMMFLSSTLYHGVSLPHLKQIFKIIDHVAIYLLIAGTYTPFMLLSVGGWMGVTATVLIWLVALTGILFKCFARGRFPKLSVITYLLMGWFAVLFVYPLYQALAAEGFWLLVLGGLCYTVGVGFYVAKHKQFTHAIWHAFVVAGCLSHFFAIYHYVI